jgi:hypothetical protein
MEVRIMRLGKVQASGYVADVADETVVGETGASETAAKITASVAAAPDAVAADREQASVSG